MVKNGKTIEDATAELHKLYQDSINRLSESFAELAKSILSLKTAFLCLYHDPNFYMKEGATDIERMVNMLTKPKLLIDEFAKDCPNKRVVHLAFHSKKFRTRKKNRNRIYKYADKELIRNG